MDEIFEHLGIALLIIISAVAQIIKFTKKADKSKGTPSAETEADIPAPHTDTVGRMPIERKPLADTTTFSPRPEFEYTFSVPVKSKKPKKAKASSHKPMQSAGQTGKTAPKRVAADTEKANPAVSADNFDIRQAIIYSEIMTPKFNEK